VAKSGVDELDECIKPRVFERIDGNRRFVLQLDFQCADGRVNGCDFGGEVWFQIFQPCSDDGAGGGCPLLRFSIIRRIVVNAAFCGGHIGIVGMLDFTKAQFAAQPGIRKWDGTTEEAFAEDFDGKRA
jgi:hypothetical protein